MRGKNRNNSQIGTNSLRRRMLHASMCACGVRHLGTRPHGVLHLSLSRPLVAATRDKDARPVDGRFQKRYAPRPASAILFFLLLIDYFRSLSAFLLFFIRQRFNDDCFYHVLVFIISNYFLCINVQNQSFCRKVLVFVPTDLALLYCSN